MKSLYINATRKHDMIFKKNFDTTRFEYKLNTHATLTLI